MTRPRRWGEMRSECSRGFAALKGRRPLAPPRVRGAALTDGRSWGPGAAPGEPGPGCGGAGGCRPFSGPLAGKPSGLTRHSPGRGRERSAASPPGGARGCRGPALRSAGIQGAVSHLRRDLPLAQFSNGAGHARWLLISGFGAGGSGSEGASRQAVLRDVALGET